MSARVHTPVPPARSTSSGTAQPPMFGVTKTSDWYAARLNRPRPWWRRIFANDAHAG